MTYNDQIQQKEFEIVKDPRVKISQADYEDQLEFLINVRDEVSRANQKIIDIRNIKNNMIFISEKTRDNIELQEMINKYLNDISEIENNIHMTKNQSRQDPLNYGIRINNRIAFLLADSQRGDYPPTNQAKAFFREITAELDREMEALEKLLNGSISRLNEIVSDNQIGIFSLKSP